MDPAGKRRLTRRSFIAHGLRLAVLAGLFIGYERRNNVEIEKIRLEYPNLPASFRDFRIVQISDLHASFWVGRKYLTDVTAAVNTCEKDLLVITGDIITGSVNDFWKRWLPTSSREYLSMAIDVLQDLKAGAKIAVLGNHDQWDGIETERRLVRELERIGFRVLRNAWTTIRRGSESIYIAGTDDIWFSYNLDKSLRGIPGDAFKILLSHSPDVTADIRKEMRIDLTLCGHTHGAQVNIPYFSRHFLPIENSSRYLAGLVKEPYGYTYVNRGIGTLVFPFRFNAPPEITCIRLNGSDPGGLTP